MKLLTTCLLAASAALLHAEVKVAVGEINDKRTTGKFFAGLEVQLQVSGPELAECKGLRVSLKEATDDGGKAIKQQENRFGRDDGFQPLKKGFGGGFASDKKADEFEVKLELENPARAAKSMKLIGSLDLLLPGKDPKSIITASVAKDAGKPLADEALKAAGVEITLKAAEGTELGYKISDPKKTVASIEFCSADGKPLEVNGWSSSGFGGSKSFSQHFSGKPPADAVAKIYLVSDKSVLSVPLKLEAVALP